MISRPLLQAGDAGLASGDMKDLALFQKQTTGRAKFLFFLCSTHHVFLSILFLNHDLILDWTAGDSASQERVLLGGPVRNITTGAHHSCALLETGQVGS